MGDHDLAATHSIIEAATRTHNKAKLEIAKILYKSNPLFGDLQWFPANGETTHTHNQQASTPTPSVRNANTGVAPTVMQSDKIVENIAVVEDRCEIDEEIAENYGESARGYLYDEEMGHVEGISQKFMTEFFNGDPATTSGTTEGLSLRYNLTSLDQVVGEGGTGDDTSSMYFIKHGKRGLFLAYPRASRGSKKGKSVVEREWRGKERITTNTTTQAAYYAYVTKLKLRWATVIRHPDAVQRLANIDDGATFDEDNAITLLANMLDAFGSLEGIVGYCNKRVWKQIVIAAKDAASAFNSGSNALGMPIYDIMGVGIKLCAGLTDVETAIS